MRNFLRAGLLSLAFMTPLAAEANAADPMTKSGCREALLGQHAKSPDNDLRNFANNNNWNSFYLEHYENFDKIGDYRVVAYVRFYNPVYYWQPNEHHTWGFCLRASDNSIRDSVNTPPSGW